MLVDIKVPVLPESVTEGTLGAWHKKVGDTVTRDENIVDLETDKVVLEIVATASGVLSSIEFEEGATVTNDQVLGQIDDSASTSQASNNTLEQKSPDDAKIGPAARKLIKQHDLKVDDIEGTGQKGAITKQDVENFIKTSVPTETVPAPVEGQTSQSTTVATQTVELAEGRNDRRVPMSRLRARIAERLKEAQNTAALLTTFNEVNLQPMMDVRSKYKDDFEKVHGTKLGMMSFFTKASVEALKKFPAVNSSIDGEDIVYHDYFDIGIAVSSERGLVVPILRDVDQMSYADIEKEIRNMAERARSGKLGIDELTGGTFSITNGGVFGSMLSTPILNPPQSAILGMHSIQQRPVVIEGEIVIRPMMYLALTYDHRIIDGREAVQFLVTIKNVLEEPARMLLQV
ncbi:MAG: 2-oxoglutarate dehydrogenase complex dihydrolipoyllysine-residue succinyltransferase [Gammaproteobacteria bacterium]|nr:2-oxoglutarate dehydrogenase complex dihydrolipoyllysine-residue succinyltransferase [Gammaproteobacteria bacterium]